ncbi:hypothetical protein HX017_17780 [Myroides marinus]|nr:hypothetical protein AS361_07980 [Myroides marinus]MDM1352557.1 hypothetical protein [Myroides marinus]MDM1359767.1 hypothetical protein [Myroides marinus]MDM1362605.1 hypothetical protein [Myroides marinus]MDM1366779.1 hypothetical protein [Myroides marinus]
MLSMFLGLYILFYLLVEKGFTMFFKQSGYKITETPSCIVGKSNTKLNYKKLNKQKTNSESLTDLLDKQEKESFKEIAKRLG